MRELCGGLDLELMVLVTPRRGALRYAQLIPRTVVLLLRRRVDVLLVQNPSLILATLAVLLRPLLRYRLVVDAHNEAIEPYINPQPWVRKLAYWVIRHSYLTIVTNRHLARVVESVGGRPFVLPDRVPSPPESTATAPLRAGFNLVLIATYACDEPIGAVLEAVRGLPVHLYVTGNASKLDAALARTLPENVTLTGFLPEEEYWGLLRAVDAVIDLTTMDNCLVCGAYEALALGKPMVLSRNAAAEELFGGAALYVDNSIGGIREAIRQLQLQKAYAYIESDQQRRLLLEQWRESANALAVQLSSA